MKFNPEKFREFRIRNGLTQEQMAVLLNIKQNTISTWESGCRKPSDITMNKIAKKFNTDKSQFAVHEEKDTGIAAHNNLSPLEELMLRKFRKMDRNEQIFMLEISLKKFESLKEEIDEYKNIIKNMSEHMDSKIG